MALNVGELEATLRLKSDLDAQLAKADQSLQGFSSSIRAVGGAIAAGFSVTQIAAAAGEVVTMTSRLDDLSVRYRISAEAVQELDFAAKQNGATFEAVGNAMAFMSRMLVGGDDSTVAALTSLGLSLDQLRALAPDQAFEAIAAAVAQVPDPMLQSALNTEIFGRGANQLLPMITSNLGALRTQARETGLVISNELVKSGDELGDTWEALTTRMNNLKAQGLLPVLNLFMELPQWMQTTIAATSELMPSLSGMGVAILAVGGPAAALAGLKAAFVAIVPYLGPVGIIAAGIIAWYAVFKNLDVFVWAAVTSWNNLKSTFWSAATAITGAAQATYEGVKLWLVDKFQAIVEWVNQKIQAIINSFRVLYATVIGGSYVPDLVAGIADEFHKLDRVMVQPVIRATADVSQRFAGIAEPTLSLAGSTGISVGASALSGAGHTTIAININGSVLGDPDKIARVVGDALLQSGQARGFRAPTGA